MELIKVGKITTAHGIKGEFKVISDSQCISKKFKKSLFIKLKDELIEMKIESVRGMDSKKIVKFDYFNSLNETENIKNISIYVLEENLPKPPKDEFYIKDLVGMSCYVENENIGEVVSVREYPQGEYLVIKTKDGNKLVPFINEFIESVTDKIVIKPIEGLL